MKVLIVAATPFEIAPLNLFLHENFENPAEYYYKKEKLEIAILITGVGLHQTTYALTKKLGETDFSLVINAGIAGAFNKQLEIGAVLNVVSDFIGDLGVEEADGSFTDIFQLGLLEQNDLPYTDGKLINKNAAQFDFLPKATSTSINKVHGATDSIKNFQRKYQIDLETMEGAAFFYVCLLEKKTFLQIRSISNYVESRNKDTWDIPLAIKNLNQVLIDLLDALV